MISLVAKFGDNLKLGTGRLDHLNHGVDAVVGQEKCSGRTP